LLIFGTAGAVYGRAILMIEPFGFLWKTFCAVGIAIFDVERGRECAVGVIF
jgi:hypothetical protein